jgi:L-aspartate oxidase
LCANDAEIKRDGLDYVHLDISHKPPEFAGEHLQRASADRVGINITKQPLLCQRSIKHLRWQLSILDGRTDAPGCMRLARLLAAITCVAGNRRALKRRSNRFGFGMRARAMSEASLGQLSSCPVIVPGMANRSHRDEGSRYCLKSEAEIPA